MRILDKKNDKNQKKVILGIHGLRNKPPADLLNEWWKKSIIEGFSALGKEPPDFKWDMAYWANFMHPKCLDPNESNPKHPRYLSEPYEPGTAFGPREPKSLVASLASEIRRHFLLYTVGKIGFNNHHQISNVLLKTMFHELNIYYHKTIRGNDGEEHLAKALIRKVLSEKLEQYEGCKIMLVAHSMGAIIAYDVLTLALPEIPIDTFVTLGAPLRFPLVLKKIRYEQPSSASYLKVSTPNNIKRAWYNLSDLDDVTALNYNLRHIYSENSHGVRPFDRIVYNNYRCEGRLNPHKSYGYLRTSDFAHIVADFLGNSPAPLGLV